MPRSPRSSGSPGAPSVTGWRSFTAGRRRRSSPWRWRDEVGCLSLRPRPRPLEGGRTLCARASPSRPARADLQRLRRAQARARTRGARIRRSGPRAAARRTGLHASSRTHPEGEAMRIVLPALALLLFAAPAEATRRHALVIGANVGGPRHEPLRYAEADAARMAAVLRDVGGFAPGDVVLLTRVDARAVRETLIELNARIREDSGPTMLFVYYSGHGDARALHLYGTELELRELRNLVAGSPARSRVLVVDACHPTPGPGSFATRARARRWWPRWWPTSPASASRSAPVDTVFFSETESICSKATSAWSTGRRPQSTATSSGASTTRRRCAREGPSVDTPLPCRPCGFSEHPSSISAARMGWAPVCESTTRSSPSRPAFSTFARKPRISAWRSRRKRRRSSASSRIPSTQVPSPSEWDWRAVSSSSASVRIRP